MAYVHCHDCDWAQDDFYSIDGYNPAEYLKSWNGLLCGEKIDNQFSDDADFLCENGPITLREVLAREYERFARRIRSMRWITFEQWKSDLNKVCPNCGSTNLDTD